jgi:hypothetical protein
MNFKFPNTYTITLFFIIVAFLTFNYLNTSLENFGTGVQTQLMTSRPYYGWYDYMTMSRNFQNQYRRTYPSRRHPHLQHLMYWWQ